MTKTLHGFGDFLSLLPHQFGFVPDDSLVLAAMEGAQIGGLVRLDADAPELWNDEQRIELQQALEFMRRRARADSWVLVSYRTESDSVEWDPFVEWFEPVLGPVQHSFVVCGDVWWATRCAGGCCDGALHELQADGALGVARELHLTDRPAESRRVVEDQLRVHDQERVDAVGRLMNEADSIESPPIRYQEAWDEVMRSPHPRDEAVASVATACGDPGVRDYFLWSVVPEFCSRQPDLVPQGYDPHPGAWSDLADIAPSALQRTLPAVPSTARGYWLALLALSRWRCGEGSGAGLAAQEALAVGPDVSLAQLAVSITAGGIPYPSVLGAA